MVKLIVVMLVTVANAQNGLTVGSHTIQGFASLADCQAQEADVRSQVTPLYAAGAPKRVTTACIAVPSKSKQSPEK